MYFMHPRFKMKARLVGVFGVWVVDVVGVTDGWYCCIFGGCKQLRWFVWVCGVECVIGFVGSPLCYVPCMFMLDLVLVGLISTSHSLGLSFQARSNNFWVWLRGRSKHFCHVTIMVFIPFVCIQLYIHTPTRRDCLSCCVLFVTSCFLTPGSSVDIQSSFNNLRDNNTISQ